MGWQEMDYKLSTHEVTAFLPPVTDIVIHIHDLTSLPSYNYQKIKIFSSPCIDVQRYLFIAVLFFLLIYAGKMYISMKRVSVIEEIHLLP